MREMDNASSDATKKEVDMHRQTMALTLGLLCSLALAPLVMAQSTSPATALSEGVQRVA